LDISNNGTEDGGALPVAVMLRDNSTLLYLNCDQNKITPAGWRMVLNSLKASRRRDTLLLPLFFLNPYPVLLPTTELQQNFATTGVPLE
jgi:hypothetical protein